MSPVEFILLAAKGAAIGLAIVAPLYAAVWWAVKMGLRREHLEGRAKAARLKAFYKWETNSPNPEHYDNWERGGREYHHDVCQYIRRVGNRPEL